MRGPVMRLTLEALAGAAFGLVVLHPVSMQLVGTDAHAGHGPPFHAGHLLLSPMAWYFAVLGSAIGGLSGWLRQQLRSRNEALSGALSEKESLLRVLAHDLSNSITASRAHLALGLESAGGVLPEEAKADLASARNALEQGRELIGCARTLLAVESGKMAIHPVPRDVAALVAESLELFRHRLAQKGLSADFVRPPVEAVACRALVEPVLLKNSVINNLLNNAVKFSPPGAWLRVEVAPAGRWVQLSVTNTGPTIPPEPLSALFTPTGRTSTPGTAGERGTGFGLPLPPHEFHRCGTFDASQSAGSSTRRMP